MAGLGTPAPDDRDPGRRSLLRQLLEYGIAAAFIAGLLGIVAALITRSGSDPPPPPTATATITRTSTSTATPTPTPTPETPQFPESNPEAARVLAGDSGKASLFSRVGPQGWHTDDQGRLRLYADLCVDHTDVIDGPATRIGSSGDLVRHRMRGSGSVHGPATVYWGSCPVP
jgi:hypothetical protein